MVSKQVIEYAKRLLNQGFRKDSARNIMISKGFNPYEVEKALNLAKKPEKNLSITSLLIISVVLIVILIPSLIFLTKDKTYIPTKINQSESHKLPEENYKSPTNERKIERTDCTINEECRFDEYCSEGICKKLNCNECEEIVDYQCIPIVCEDNNTCTIDSCSAGSCFNTEITSCINNDGCCPLNCNDTLDTDCAPPQNITQHECYSDLECDDNNYLTYDECNIEENETVRKCFNIEYDCEDNDLICPTNCTSLNDNDCLAVCGNNITETTETCDGNCPTNSDCDDNNLCTNDTLEGYTELCNVYCVNEPIIICSSGDGCCPTTCSYATDTDCEPSSTQLATGSFTSVQQQTNGNIELNSYEDGTIKVVFNNEFLLTNAELSNNLQVYLATMQTVTTLQDLEAGNYVLEPLKQLNGEQKYLVPITNIQNYNSVVIYQSSYNAVYAYATLNYI